MRRVRTTGRLLLIGCALAACGTPAASRAELTTIDAEWRFGTMEEGSFARMIVAVRSLGTLPADEEASLRAIPDLLRLVASNPSGLVRAESLRSAWALGGGLPPEPWRVDELDRELFNERTRRLEELVNDEQPPGPEAFELARWLAAFRVPQGGSEELRVAIGLCEVVLSQALYREDELGAVFRAQMEGSLTHALNLATLHAAADPLPVVREEALASARHLDPDVALQLVEGILDTETDAAVVLAALDSLGEQVARLDTERLRVLLQPLADSTDVAVKRRVRAVLGQLPS